ncbi:MAG: DUF2788 domain-containing protein [Chromatiaceae bacterium]
MQVTEEQIASLGLTWGLGILIGLMLWIIWDLARKSKAGKFGTFILFFVLAFGIFGFLMKNLLEWLLQI